jgi:hypothetical protein
MAKLQWPAMVTGPPWTELYRVHGSPRSHDVVGEYLVDFGELEHR